MRTLVLQREVALARKIAAALIEAGHDPMVVHDAAAGIKEVIKGSFDLIVLDVGRRQADTLEFLRQLRAQRVNSRILILSARSEITDRVTALQSGADDYLSKPFAMSELIARANSLGRRYLEQPRFTLRVGDLTVDLADHQVHRADKQIELSLRELALLKVLMREPGLHARVNNGFNDGAPSLGRVLHSANRRLRPMPKSTAVEGNSSVTVSLSLSHRVCHIPNRTHPRLEKGIYQTHAWLG